MKKLMELYDRVGLRLAAIWEEKGQTTIEYILVIVLIVLLIVFAVFTSTIGDAINTAVDTIASALRAGS